MLEFTKNNLPILNSLTHLHFDLNDIKALHCFTSELKFTAEEKAKVFKFINNCYDACSIGYFNSMVTLIVS